MLANPSGNSLELSDLIIDGAAGIGILVGNAATVTGHDVVVRNTQFDSRGIGGRGINVEYGGEVTLNRVVLEGNRENAVNVAEQGSKVSLSDVSIRDTQARADESMGRAATVNKGAELSLTRAIFEKNREASVWWVVTVR